LKKKEEKTVDELQKEVVRLKKELKKKKKYGLVWEEKPEDVVEMCKEKLPILKEVRKKEIITDKNQPINILIEGDNYHALSTLNYTHSGKIDVIYIDPPYNTGLSDFRFNDKYIDSRDSYRHSKWLSYMEKRLKLAKKLLRNTGSIFISVDDIEMYNLKLLLDDIFKNNFIGTLIWRKKEGGGQTDSYFVTEHEYILAFQKSSNFKWLDEEIEIEDSSFKHIDKKGKFNLVRLAKWGNGARRVDRPKMHFPIYTPGRKKVLPKAPDGSEGRWRVGKTRMEELIKSNRVVFLKKNNDWIAYEKIYFESDNTKKIKERSILYEISNTSDATNTLTNILGSKDVFQNPKPVELIKFILRHSGNSSATILDFFAGSGTTGHAVLEINKEDKGKRKFILVTNNENNICTEVCYPRIEKVINGYKNLKKKKIKGLSGNLKYFKTDFVDAKPTDKNKKKLTEEATEMLCIREDTFKKVETKNKSFKVFKNGKKYTGIIYDVMMIDKFKDFAKKIDGEFSVYIFSLSDDTYDEEFEDMNNKIKLSPIPEAILRVYRRIFK
jgi:adenine-specific DNA-methyltransferase